MLASYSVIFLTSSHNLAQLRVHGEGIHDEALKTSAREATIMFMYLPHMDPSYNYFASCSVQRF